MTVDVAAIRAVGDHFLNALALVDLSRQDQPLVYVNRAFSALTGYSEDEILGRNCRFLQGLGTDRNDVEKIRQAITRSLAFYCDLLNYRKDGRPFFNRLVLLPLALAEGPHYIGMQIDSTPLVATAVARGRDFNQLKTSEDLRDRINNPLMKIAIASTLEEASDLRERILEESFAQILETVRSLPFRL